MISLSMAYGSWTECPTMEAHGSCLEAWFSVQPEEDKNQGPKGEILWMPLWWIWSPPRSREGWCCTCPDHANQHHRASRVPWHGNIPQPLHSWSFHPDSSPPWATQEGCRIQLGYFFQTAFQCVKDAVVSDTTLQYFDASCPVTVQVDALQVRLGAALLQDNKPVAFASKALTEVECHYAKTECEMLAVVFRAEQFRTYIHGRPFTIKSDHKPLETITKKSLADAPAQLQCMLLCLQGCAYVLCYCPGKEMVLPDTLSCFKPKPGPELHWILPSTMPTYPLSKRKPSNWLLRWMLKCVP